MKALTNLRFLYRYSFATMPGLGKLLCGGIIVLSHTLTAHGLFVEPDRENIVSMRLEGTWYLARESVAPPTDKPIGTIHNELVLEFRSERQIAANLPQAFTAFLAKKRIFMAGTMNRNGTTHPFVLIEHHGNPHVLYFREHDGDPVGDAESFNLLIAVAADRADDVLFVGGRTHNQPMRKLTRSRRAIADETPEMALRRSIAEMLRLLTEKEYRKLIIDYAQPTQIAELDESGLIKLVEQYARGTAAHLFAALEKTHAMKPTFNEDQTEARFPLTGVPGGALVFKQINRHWYLIN